MWLDDSPMASRTLQGYSFDPTTMALFPIQPDQDTEENRIESEATIAEEHVQKRITHTKTQTTLDHFWKKYFIGCLYQ
jgi:hypothetical protein